MTIFSYVTHGNNDPEEIIEENMLLDEIRKHIPDILATSHEGAIGTVAFGRLSSAWAAAGRFAWPPVSDFFADYWKDPTFLANAGREHHLCSLEEAEEAVERIHAAGHDAFVKAVKSKLMTLKVPRGQRLLSALEEMAYSFMDQDNCLMVQQSVQMEYEYRIFVADGQLITAAGCIMNLTPKDNEDLFDVKLARKISAPEVERRPDLVEAYLDFARAIVPKLLQQTCTLDLCLIDGKIAIVECNPCIPGGTGLYACDVEAFATTMVNRTLAALPTLKVAPIDAKEHIVPEGLSSRPSSFQKMILKLRKDHLGIVEPGYDYGDETWTEDSGVEDDTTNPDSDVAGFRLQL